MAFDTGNGATLTRTGLTVDITAIRIGEQTIDMLDKSTLATTGFTEKLAADLTDAGSVTVEFLYDSDDGDITMGGAAVSTVITWPLQSGQTTAANLTGTAVITSKKFPDFVNNELQAASVTLTWDGVTGPTLTAAV